ncbi:uncharacterized protein LOC142164056 [Nicotiana tabacum]|uniref:Uncharacterized protein LOC142164056 n=1 Tax=Nicotiana tabacum TaxID=4097 RepID=A0AC58RX79_TOBAC
MAEVDNEAPEKLGHSHPLFLNSNDNSETILISLQLRGLENYSVWSRAMRIAILGRNKLGFIDGKCKRENYGPNLVDLWDICNAIVLSWIMNCVSPELLSGNVYSSNASVVWNDLKESLAPIPGCDCEKSREFIVFMERLKLLQFLMGLNESYEQARSQLLMMIHAPSVNKAYSMLTERKSQRAIAHTGASGHTRENCFKLNGYPADFKSKIKGGALSAANFAGNSGGYVTAGLQMHPSGAQEPIPAVNFVKNNI